MPRAPRTPEQASALNAAKWNRRQRDAAPLFMQAGLEADLIATGILRDRPADHQLRVQAQATATRAAFDHACRERAAAYARTLKAVNRAAWAAALLNLRSLRARSPALRQPHMAADHWHGALRAACTHGEYLTHLGAIHPEHAATVRRADAWRERHERQVALGTYAPWTTPRRHP